MYLSRLWLAGAALLPVVAVEATPPAKFRMDYTGQCQYFRFNCQGSQQGLSVHFTDQGGETRVSLIQVKAKDGLVIFDETASLGKFVSLHGVSQWHTGAQATFISGKRVFRVSEGLRIAAGAYAGHIKGQIYLDSRIDVDTKPLLIKIGNRQYSIPAYHRTLAEDRQEAVGKSVYGGVTLDSGYGYKVMPQVMGIAGQSATVGMDRMTASLNAGVMMASQAGYSVPIPTGDICQGQAVFPKHGTLAIINMCFERTYRDPFYDLEREKAGELGYKISNTLSRVAEAVRYKGPVPVYGADRVLHEFGVTTSPYHLRPSIQLAIAGRHNDIGWSGGIKIPVGNYKEGGKSFYGSIEYSFK